MRLRYVLQFGLLLTLFWVPVPSAQAHAELVAANPATNSHIDALPAQVSVTFDGNLLTMGGVKTNVLIVQDPTGKEIDAQDCRISGATLTVGVKPVTTTGEFLVSWRVVSGDGHPEQGSYRFFVNSSQTIISTTPTPTPVATPTTSTPRATDPDFLSRYRTRLSLLLGAAIAVGIWVRFEYARRKSKYI